MANLLNWNEIAAELREQKLQVIREPQQLQKLSLDYYHFSPILTRQLGNKRADLVIAATTELEVLQVAKYCVEKRIPLTVRGAGTGNYGQCIPLQGGIVLDLSGQNRVLTVEAGKAIAEPGVKMAVLDRQAKAIGWELRMAPSTYQTATLGGFLGGGSVGMGSINYGMISDRGNVRALRIVTLEENPQVLTLQGEETQAVLHAYGTNGIITQLEMPLAPAYPWTEIIVCFEEFNTAIAFAMELAESSGIVKKEIAVHAAPIPTYFTALKDYLKPNNHCVLVIMSEYDLAAFQALVKIHGGEITLKKDDISHSKHISLLEFNWNHTTLLARAKDANLTYLQVFYGNLENVQKLYQYFGDEVMVHLEFLRVNDKIMPVGIPLVRFTTEERLQEIIDYHQTLGANIANPHVFTIEGGGSGSINPEQLALKKQVDPYGLLNPGKMRTWVQSNG